MDKAAEVLTELKEQLAVKLFENYDAQNQEVFKMFRVITQAIDAVIEAHTGE